MREREGEKGKKKKQEEEESRETGRAAGRQRGGHRGEREEGECSEREARVHQSLDSQPNPTGVSRSRGEPEPGGDRAVSPVLVAVTWSCVVSPPDPSLALLVVGGSDPGHSV